MAYKKLIKVSNVCQVLDKRKYPATKTTNGVTWTNNGDGTITANGTLTINAYSTFDISSNIKIVKGHKYALLGGQGDKNIIGNLILRNINQSDYDGKWWYVSTRTNWIGVAPASFPAKSWMDFGNKIGYVANNLTFKPQLFDLTEMYGAGHEPTTVEQFRQDFPEEMYDYSPHCWLTSYKRVFMTGGGNYLTSYQRNLTCKTKNLFDISKVTETDKLKVKGNSIYSYTYPVNTNATSTLSIFKSLKPNTNYTISAITNYLGDSTTSITLIFNNGDLLNVFGQYTSGFVQNTFSLTQEQIDNIKSVYFYGKEEDKGGPIIWSNIQIEEGDTATDYVPYGHL